MNPASNVVLVGPMGAGKTSIGKRLADRFGLVFADCDREIESHTGAKVATIFDCEGEAGFRARERATLAALLADDGAVIATGGGAVLDADNRHLMQAHGFVIYLRVGLAEQLERLSRDRARPLIARADREDVLKQLAAAREPLYASIADMQFDTSGLSPLTAVARLGKQLDTQWRMESPA